jgi:electron transfer flavoprotein beta subunit
VKLAACLKLVDRRPEVDPITGVVHDEDRYGAASGPDLAALEWALRCADAWSGEVIAVTAGSSSADAVLRDALAAGAAGAVRVDLDPEAPSEVVAAALAPHLKDCDVVWCGDSSLDRGSGAVPAYLAAWLGASQALGLVGVEPQPEPGEVVGTRRLDGGRRERLRVLAPAVVSVEGSAARLRRATLAAKVSSRAAPLSVVGGPVHRDLLAHRTRPFRPRPRILPGPAGDHAFERILQLTATHAAPAAVAAVELGPDAAADRILEALTKWGYLDLNGPADRR